MTLAHAPSTAAAPLPSALLESGVLERYSGGANRVEPALCCPTNGYDAELLAKLPPEIVEKDYGCGDPSVHAREGDLALDLGSGSGKVCYLLSQRVGPSGRVIGLDFNDDMLELARRYREEMGRRLGWSNVEFRKARIQDMALDLDAAAKWLEGHPVRTLKDLAEFERWCETSRREQPLVRSGSVDLVVSNCVLNLVRPEEKRRLFIEMYRVLARGGRAVISDIVCDEDPTPAILGDPELWSGCIAGAFREDRFLEAFEAAGFYGVEIVARSPAPWRVVDGVEFRSVTVRAFKGKEGPCIDRNQAVILKGPWRTVTDDDGHTFHRGQRMAVCDKTFELLTNRAGPYATHVLPVPPAREVPVEGAPTFVCNGERRRDPRQTKAGAESPSCAPSSGNCC